MKDWLMTILKGGVIGGTMLVPGVSGGTIAIIIGIYDRLVDSVSSFTKDIKKNFLFLMFFCLGAGAGFVLAGLPINLAINYPVTHRIAMSFFIGIIAAGIPVIFREAQIKKFKITIPLYILIGVALVFGIAVIRDEFEKTGVLDTENWFKYIIVFIVGIVSSVALVLPGISFSQMLEVIGLGDRFRAAISLKNGLNVPAILFIVVLGVGILIGIFAMTKLLDNALKKFPTASYMIIFGFIIGSIYEFMSELIVPSEVPKEYSDVLPLALPLEITLCAVAAVVGFVVFMFVSKLEDKKTTNKK